MTEPTFRDFAGAIMSGDAARAAEVLAVLLGLDAAAATAATEHFRASMTAAPNFVTKAMGLRTAVTSGNDAEIAALLVDCFGLDPSSVPTALTALRKRYPA